MTFRKHRDDAPTGFYEAEAAGLRWLGEATEGARVVEVMTVGPGSIELAQLTGARDTARAAREFGAALARTHAAGAAAWVPHRTAGPDRPSSGGSR